MRDHAQRNGAANPICKRLACFVETDQFRFRIELDRPTACKHRKVALKKVFGRLSGWSTDTWPDVLAQLSNTRRVTTLPDVSECVPPPFVLAFPYRSSRLRIPNRRRHYR